MSLNQEMPRDTVDALLARVRSIPARRRIRAWLIPFTMLVVCPVGAVKLEAISHMEPVPLISALASAIALCLGVWVWAEQRDMRKVAALAGCAEMRTLGALIESLTYSNRRVRAAAQSVLLALLPRLTEADCALLNTREREILNSLLYGSSGELALATLAALEQVGDGTALPYLNAMAEGRGVAGALRSRQAEVQERARHAVQTIGERIERQNRPNVLLRAAQTPETPAAQLVRPVQEPASGDGQELLRSAAGAESNSSHK